MKKRMSRMAAGCLLALALTSMGGYGIMENQLTLTEAEINILVSTGASPKRIEAGELTSLETADLEVFNAVRKEMEARYPDETIVYEEMDVAARGGEGYSFKAYTESRGPEALFTIFAELKDKENPGRPEVSDNLIGQRLLPGLRQYLDKLFAGFHLPVLGYTASLPALQDASFNRGMTAEEHIAAGDLPLISVMLHLSADSLSPEAFEEMAKQLEEALRRDGVQGSVYLIGQTGETVDTWRNVKYRRQILL